MTRKGASGGGMNQDDQVFAPYTTVMKKLSGNQFVNRIYVVVAHRPTSSTARPPSVAAALRIQHEIEPGDADDFTVQTQDDIVALRTADREHDDVAAGGHRRRLARRRRHRHHEHHAGVGHRAHARDRPAPGDRRARLRRAAAVPDRGGRHQHRRRRRRDRRRIRASRSSSRSTSSRRRSSRWTRWSSPWASRPRSASSSGSTPPGKPPASTRSRR